MGRIFAEERMDVEDVFDNLHIYIDPLEISGVQTIPITYSFTDAGRSLALLNAIMADRPVVAVPSEETSL
jgi:hypothetical protein